MAPKGHSAVNTPSVMRVMTVMTLLCLEKTADSFHSKPSYRLQDSIEITTEIVTSWKACFKSCQARKGCLSVEMHIRFRLCRLSSSDRLTTGASLIRSPGIWYSEKRDWTEMTIDQRCLGLCSVTERCIIDVTVNCQISECEQAKLLDNSSMIFGSELSVGSNILHVCPDTISTAVSECGTDGQWSLRQFTCSIVCPSGWEKFQRSCYKFDDTFMNFESAETYCRSLNQQGRLVHVESSEENVFLIYYLNSLPTLADYWIGMTDVEEERQWKWHGTNVDVQFVDWKPNEAYYNKNENCAVFGDTINYKWADVACGSNRKVVCEIDHGT